MIIKLETRAINPYIAEHTGYLLITLNGKKYRRKLLDTIVHNEWRYKFRLNNTFYLLPWGLGSLDQYVDINQLEIVQ